MKLFSFLSRRKGESVPYIIVDTLLEAEYWKGLGRQVMLHRITWDDNHGYISFFVKYE